MPFPKVQRVIYGKNPLDTVICQLRFPPILKIDAEVPARFQERIRADFPNFSEKRQGRIEVPRGVQDEIPLEVLGRLVQDSSTKRYEFSSEDEEWRISLTRTFLALTANNYQRWEDFREKLMPPLKALIDVYSPTRYSRIGLRYIDVIRRSTLDLDDTDWTELLQPYVLGVLSAPDVGSSVRMFDSTYEVILSDGKSKVRIKTDFVRPAEGEEVCYRIDSDFFDERKTDIGSATEKLEYLRKRGSRLFRWCITDHLHMAMEPREI